MSNFGGNPIRPGAATPRPPGTAPLQGYPQHVATPQKLVLVVDDSATIRKIVEVTLRREGFRVTTAEKALDALATVQDETPDLILLDVMLPVMNGYDLCSRIRKMHRHVPIIMLTSKDGMFDKLRGRLAGSTLYMTKPFEPKVLVETVKKYVVR